MEQYTEVKLFDGSSLSVCWNGPTVDVIRDSYLIVEPFTPGTAHMLDMDKNLVGGRIENILDAYWTDDKIANFFAMIFGRGASALFALRWTCPNDTMRKKYREHWKSEPPF